MTLKELRENKGLTQVELAAKLGLTGPAVNQYENSKRMPNIQTVKRIAEILEVSVETVVECFC